MQRNLHYDLIRLLGLCLIMVAHSSPPTFFFQLRNFDVPLLVVASGLSYALVYANRSIHLWSFYLKRMSRLILPAWVFLTAFFAAIFVFVQVVSIEYPFSLSKIALSYSFISGIGFVWIFKVFITLALTTPLALYLNRRISSNTRYFVLLAVVYVVYEGVCMALPYMVGEGLLKTLHQTVFVMLPYTIVYFYGFRLARLTRQQVLMVIAASGTIFVGMALWKFQEIGVFVPTQEFKYPPTLYYLSYAFFMLNAVYLLCLRLNLKSKTTARIVTWLSANSLWIYLWHIMAAYLWTFLLPDPEGAWQLFIAKTFFLLSFGGVLVVIQNKIVEILANHLPSSAHFFLSLLTGEKLSPKKR